MEQSSQGVYLIDFFNPADLGLAGIDVLNQTLDSCRPHLRQHDTDVLDPGPGETNTEDDLDETIALYDPKWERNTVQLAHNPYSKESIVQRKFSKMQFQLPHPGQVDPDDTDLKGQGGPKRLNVGPKDINKNFNYNNIKKNFVINREGADDKEEYEDFAFKWTDQRTKAKISSSSSMESSDEEEEGEEEAFECMQVDILIDLGCLC